MKTTDRIEHWQTDLEEKWGITANLSALDGEYDLNFLAKGHDGNGYVLKVMRTGCEMWLVDMQVKAFEHITEKQANLPCPIVVRATNDAPLLTLLDENGAERLVWVLAQLPGQCYAHVGLKSDALIHELGQVLGGTALALADFKHDGLERDFKWDLMRAGWIADEMVCISDPDRGGIVQEIYTQFAELKPELAT